MNSTQLQRKNGKQNKDIRKVKYKNERENNNEMEEKNFREKNI